MGQLTQIMQQIKVKNLYNMTQVITHIHHILTYPPTARSASCMQCDFHFDGIFNILRIHTYIYVIPYFQGMSFTFNVKKS